MPCAVTLEIVTLYYPAARRLFESSGSFATAPTSLPSSSSLSASRTSLIAPLSRALAPDISYHSIVSLPVLDCEYDDTTTARSRQPRLTVRVLTPAYACALLRRVTALPFRLAA